MDGRPESSYIIKILFYLFIVTLPFQFALNPVSGIDLAIGRVIALLVVALCFFQGLKERSLRISLSPLSLFMFLFLFWSGLSLFWSDSISGGVRKFLFLLNFLPFFWVFPLVLVKFWKSDFQNLRKAILYPALLAVMVGIAQFGSQFLFGAESVFSAWAGFAPFVYGQSFSEAILTYPSWLVDLGGEAVFRAIAFFPDPHIFGFYLAFVTPLAFLSHKLLYNIFGAVFIIALLLTFSRAAYIGALGASVIFFLVTIIKNPTPRIKLVKVLGVVLSIAFLSFSFLFTPFGSRLASSFDLLEGSRRERIEIWRGALDIIRANPVLGVGLGGYASTIEPGAEYRIPLYAHNLYLDIWAELGIVGLMLWLGIMGIAMRSSLIRGQYAVFFTLFWFSLQSFFDTPLFSVHILPLLILFLALSSPNFGSRTSKIPQPSL